jgi:hypothetical protein
MFFNILFMFVFCFVYLFFYFVYSLFVCFIYRLSFCAVSFLFLYVQVYRPLPPDGNPLAVNKYHILSYHMYTYVNVLLL